MFSPRVPLFYSCWMQQLAKRCSRKEWLRIWQSTTAATQRRKICGTAFHRYNLLHAWGIVVEYSLHLIHHIVTAVPVHKTIHRCGTDDEHLDCTKRFSAGHREQNRQPSESDARPFPPKCWQNHRTQVFYDMFLAWGLVCTVFSNATTLCIQSRFSAQIGIWFLVTLSF